MKKLRAATKITVLCTKQKVKEVEDILFKHLSTIGIRKYVCERTVLDRRIETVTTSFGDCRFKIVTHRDMTYAYPEYEDVKRIALDHDLSFNEVYSKLKSLESKRNNSND
ncbi:MAG: hypothetical protein ATN33_04905 [Epulopiscium sp. Nele67-Bin001]|nr:MAG: hypothetical protein BEN18_07365 [Epulopiscium sp. Nuni2H_MBin001]OON94066.1 MAG: hypothetical protein ATN33_04905 [Epulopiscium sp. Nele67-Bin001]